MSRVVIVGGGLAGLGCARILQQQGIDWEILEASDAVGGRVRTDVVEGFRLDRGFQVFLTSYREAGEVLDLPTLDLKPFYAGALVHDGGGFARIANPIRHPVAAALSVATRPVTLLDAVRMAPMAVDAARARPVQPGAPEGPVIDLFRRLDLGAGFVDGFLRSFFGGVFLDRSLRTDASIFRFLLSAFARGETTVPAAGMGAIPAQIAAALPADRIHLHTPVAGIRRRGRGFQVQDARGAAWECDAVVVAADMSRAHLLDERIPVRRWQQTTTFQYACLRSELPAELQEPVLLLDGMGTGPVNHAACISSVAPGYAPEGRALVSLNLVDTDWSAESMTSVQARVVVQMERWFGRGAMRGWRLLRTDRIAQALPRQHQDDLRARPGTILDDGIFLAGDHVTEGSIDGALRSGRFAAEAACGWLGARGG